MKSVKSRAEDGLRVKSWLRDIGYDPKPVDDPSMNWQFQFAHPTETSHQLAIFNAKHRPRAVVIVTQVTVSPQHTAGFQELDEESKLEFLFDLSVTLTREYTEYALRGLENGIACPTEFQITAVRFDDGLTLDSIARSISSVYKAEQAAILCFQRHLTPRSSGGSGAFEFRRMIQ